jgi:hypothetical protein
VLTEIQRNIVRDCLQSRILILEDEAEGVGGGDYVHSIALEIEDLRVIQKQFLPIAGSWAAYFDTGEAQRSTNSCRFATKEEAEAHGFELMSRWMRARAFDVRKELDMPNAVADLKTGQVEML